MHILIKRGKIPLMVKEKSTKSLTFRTLHHYWAEVKATWRYNLPLLFTMPLAQFLGGFATTWIMSMVINRLTTDPPPADQVMVVFLPYLIAYSVSIMIGELFLYRLNLFLLWKSELISMKNLHEKCFDSLAEQSMHFHNNRFGGSLVSQQKRFVGGYERLMDSTFWTGIPLACTFIFSFAILGPQLPLFTLILASLCAGFMAFAAFSSKKLNLLFRENAADESKMTGQLADSISNISAVKGFANEKHESKLYTEKVKTWQNSSLAAMWGFVKRDFGFGAILSMIAIATFIFLIGGNAWFGAPIGTLVLAVTYMIQIWGQLWKFNSVLRDYNRAFADAQEMTEILDLPKLVVDKPRAGELHVARGKVEFRDVTFRHQGAKDAIFKNFKLTIPAGQRIGLVGHSGSGKTTFTKLVLRFSDIGDGEILIDGQNIAKVMQKSLRQNIAYVPQEPLLFHRTIAENIAYGKLDAPMDDIREAAKLANALEFIDELPDKFDTLTGERGVKLSGGQRQRVAIARAILTDAPILILDEATSALDTESEKLIQDALRNLMKGRTSIVIAHRLSTVAELDRIIVLENGRIVEDGSHAELIEKSGVYARLWNRQTGTIKEQ